MDKTTFTGAKAQRDALEARLDATTATLKAFPRTGALGLVSDDVRLSSEYQTARKASVKAFDALRAFNVVFVKCFASELRAERNAKRRV